MDGIVSAFNKTFAPTVTADKVIWHAAHGLAQPPEMSCSAQVVIGIMTALHLNTLPLFDKLYDYFTQPSSYDPKELKLLATLGCEAAMVQIDVDTTTNERSINIELGEHNDPYTTLFFIERKKTNDPRETEVFVRDYTGVEKPCPEEFSTLEKIISFYKEDLAENREGIYSQHVSENLFVQSTLGVALGNYGSAHFDQHDLLNVEKFFGLQEGSTQLEEWQNPNLQDITSSKIVDALIKMDESQWESTLSQLSALLQVSPIIGDMQLHVANLIKARAEEEVRCNVFVHLTSISREIRDHLIKLAGVYALAKASLTPKQAASIERNYFVQKHIEGNINSLNTVKEIFCSEIPDVKKAGELWAAYEKILDLFPLSVVPTKEQVLRGTLHAAITYSFNAVIMDHCFEFNG